MYLFFELFLKSLDFRYQIIIRILACENKNLIYRGFAQMARALGLGPRGREFESRIPESICVSFMVAWR